MDRGESQLGPWHFLTWRGLSSRNPIKAKFQGNKKKLQLHQKLTNFVEGIGVGLEERLLHPRLLEAADLGVPADVLLPSEAAATLVAKKRFVFCKERDNHQPMIRGSGCSTAEERTSHYREVVGSNSAGCWAFFSSLSSHKCVFNSGPSSRCKTTDFAIK